jgi:hypothetical protein
LAKAKWYWAELNKLVSNSIFATNPDADDAMTRLRVLLTPIEIDSLTKEEEKQL